LLNMARNAAAETEASGKTFELFEEEETKKD
jgi:hypothetical protein